MRISADSRIASLVRRIDELEERIKELRKGLEHNVLEGRITKRDGDYYLEVSIPYSVLMEMLKKEKELRREIERIEYEYEHIVKSGRVVMVFDFPLEEAVKNAFKELDIVKSLYNLETVSDKINDIKKTLDSLVIRVKAVQSMVYELEKRAGGNEGAGNSVE